MSFTAGSLLGPYEVLDKLGEGGMGEVYRARDAKLNRDVALKVLPESFATDPDRLARFKREAQVLASLNHPHIGAIYGFEDSGSVHALVLELVEGPTLADRIARGPIPLDEALPIARQVAEALEAAHEQGIIHRDLKPANIKVRADGTVKVLDFGLAKALDRVSSVRADLTHSPTIMNPTSTLAGTLLGTAAYMSPEEARGKAVDKRADIWAFGCVLFEMLAGRKPFDGDALTDVAAAIIKNEPDSRALPPGTLPGVRSLIARCLRKDPAQRLHDIADGRLQIEEAVSDPAGAAVVVSPARHSRERLAWIAVALFLGTTVLFAALLSVGRRPIVTSSGDSISFDVFPPARTDFFGAANTTINIPSFALSPDGHVLVFSAGPRGAKPTLWVRSLDHVEARQLAGTEDAQDPMWDPASRWIGFFADGKLKKIPAAGGAVQVIAQTAADFRGETWGPENTILFGIGAHSILRINAAGGTPMPATTLTHQGDSHRNPQILPDGHHFLYSSFGYSQDQNGVYAGSLDDGKTQRLLLHTTSNAIYASPGYLLFVDGDSLLGQQFDAERLELEGQPFLVAEHVGRNTGYMSAVSASRTGVIAYAGTLSQNGRLTWLDRAGNAVGVIGPAGDYSDFRLSPDDARLAASLVDPKTNTVEIWIMDLMRGGSTRVGEVYRARDTRLERVVAIKILPESLADDPQFRERFDREARSISQLDHPHICTLYDVGDQGGTAFLVMQYLEGETLEQRLKKGALPVDQALHYAIQIVAALDKAHRAGIVHRDLKPGNIFLCSRGPTPARGRPASDAPRAGRGLHADEAASAKLLDFGLAKSASPPGEAAGLSMLPTSPPSLTAQGTILGTFQYMAPEQIEGQDADSRTDIFAFGVVLYEMVTGKTAFEGKTSASLLGAILKDQPPPLSATQPLAPSLLDRTLRRCLAKDPDARWQTATDLLEELKWIDAEGQKVASVATRQTSRRDRVWLVVGAAVGAAAVTAGSMYYLRPATAEFPLSRVDIVTPPTSDPFSFALSHDGRQLAFVATTEGSSRLWVRSLDQVSARAIAGTEGACYPFWSPDGRAIGFFASGKLKRIDLAAGAPQVLADVPGARGGTWNRDGVILFAPQQAGLMRIAATGGTPVAVTHLAKNEGSHRWPQFLPDGRRFLFFVGVGVPSTHGVYLGRLDGQEPTRLLAGETAAWYAPPGYLLRVVQGALVAHRVDADHRIVSDESVPLAQAVGTDDGTFHSAFSVSNGGVIAHRDATIRRQLVWVDRTGTVTGALRPPDDAMLASPQLAPDGRRVGVIRNTVQGGNDVWFIDVASGTLNRVTFDPGQDSNFAWSPDATRIIFASTRNGKWDLFEKPLYGAADEKERLVTAQDKSPLDWSPDGRVLLYAVRDANTGMDIWALPLLGDAKPFLTADF